MANLETTKTCIKDTVINGLAFICGFSYKVDFNVYSRTFFIYNIHGYTDILKETLDRNFI